MLSARSVLFDLNSYNINNVNVNGDSIEIAITSKRRTAPCPKCGKTSRSVHSRYVRTLCHVPIALRNVRLLLRTRRFRCRNSSCERRIYAERNHGLARVYARTTEPNRSCIQRIGAAVGAKPGTSLAKTLGMTTSATTLRRRILEMPVPEQKTVRVLGVDDWAWRKGRRYGTLLCDLESGQIVDILPERSAKSLAEWLTDHPGVEIISRDRASCYAEGGRQGAPDAIQVADRWHLLKNMAEALERLIYRRFRDITSALQQQVSAPSPQAGAESEGQDARQETDGTTVGKAPSKAECRSAARREARIRRYNRVLDLRRNGKPILAIAKELRMSRSTVKKHLAAESFTERAAPTARNNPLDAYEQFIRERLAEDGTTVKALLAELKLRGFEGSHSALYRYVGLHPNSPRPRKARTARPAQQRCPSPRSISLMLMRQAEKQTPEDLAIVQRLTNECSDIASASEIARTFAKMVCQRQASEYEEWRRTMDEARVPELSSFADSLNRDRDAVIAALTLQWSNGPTEGHVNRLKTVKRQMYGRAGFEMLRKRVLIPP